MWRKLKKITVTILAVLGVLFIIIMLMPDDEESEDRPREEADVIATVEESDSTESASKEKDGPSKEKGSGEASTENVESISVGTEAKSATVMIYMNGSDLETNAGEATDDIAEMISSGIGDNVNVIIQTMGTKEWQNYGISSKTAQTYKIENGDLKLVRNNLGQLDCTSKDTLSEFIGFCKNNYTAERYIFIFWDHGGGPVYGFGYDEWQSQDSSLTIAEMAAAFSEHSDIYFDVIGMDCCIMANLETCYALSPFCRYTVLSEDFESGLGWSYTGWMKKFEENPGISAPLLGKNIIDDIISDNEDSFGGDSACLGLFNESTARNLFTAWKAYAYKNEDALLNKNYSKIHMAKGRSNKGFWDMWGFDESDVTLSDYYISDILALVEGIDNSSDEAKALMSALKAAVAYYGHTSDKNELTGLSVSLPYGDSYFYEQLKSVYKDIDFDEEYIEWLARFVSAESSEDYYNYDSFEDSWNGWGAYEDEYGCNISGGGSCEYGYDYDSGDYYGYQDEWEEDNWIYDYEEEIWYLYENGTLYLYDDKTETTYYYDEDTDEVFYYDESADDWFLAE
jgi:hypothetical protein